MTATRASLLRCRRVPRPLFVLALAAGLWGCVQNAEQIDPRTSSLITANNTITQAADETRTGWFPDQPQFDPSIVGSGTFKRIFNVQLDPASSQQILAQPLVVNGRVLVVTEANNAYLVDALTGAVVGARNFGSTFDATAIGCADVSPTVGITGTPVVDTTTGTAYFYSKNSAGTWTLHAVSTSDLSERANFPVTISGSAQNDATVTFDSTYEHQRTGLLLMNGVVYAGFGAHCDVGPYRGWIIGVTTGGAVRTRFTTLANTTARSGDGIWMSGAGLASDGPGQILFSTGNGAGNPYANPLPSNTPPSDLQNSVARAVVQVDGSLQTTDFFAPFNAISLGNEELGSGGVVTLPPQFGTPATPRLAVAAGKAGTLFLLDRDRFGGFQQGPNRGDATLAAIPLGGSSFSRPGVWPGDGGYVYVTVNGGTTSTGYNLQVFKYAADVSGNPTLTMVGKAPDNVGFFSGSPIVTSNGLASGSALVWMTNLTAELRIYDAVPVNGVLNIRFRDSYGAQAKFTTIGIGAGTAYIGTGDGHLVAYGAGTQSVSGSPVAFGAVNVGQPKTLTATITASQNVTVTEVSSSSAAFTLGAPSASLPVTLSAGQILTVPVTFTPMAATSYTATLTVTTSSMPGALTMTGSGQASGPQLLVSPTALDFGGIAIGTSRSLSLLLSNNGTSTLTFSGITAPGGAFSVTGGATNGSTLAPGASTNLTVTFSPTATASYAGSFVVGSDGGSVTVSLTGRSGPPANLVITPMTINFGSVIAGTSTTLSFTLQNTGGVDLTISKSKPPVLGPFVAQTSLPEGSTIAAGQTLTETVKLTANALGTLSDAWVISGNDATGVHNVTFTANGVTSLPRNGWVATASTTGGGDVPAQAIDQEGGSTRWSTGQPQSNDATQSFTLDMLSPQSFSMILVDSGGDYARNWEVYASDSTADWGTAIATGTATANPVIITFPTQNHRYLQMRQKASAGTNAWWSIDDMNVLGSAGTPVLGPGPLPRYAWIVTGSATAGNDIAENAVDLSTASRWSTGLAQSSAATQSFTIDMRTPQTFNQIEMDSGGDYCRSYQVFVSADGIDWGSPVATGNAMMNPVLITFATQTARFVQVRQLTSPGTGAWWSIWDFEIIAGGTPPKTPIARTGWTASASRIAGNDVPANAVDPSTGSRWSTGLPQSDDSTQSFTLDMQTPQTFSQITLASGGDYARNWQAYASSDGTSWGTPLATGTATANNVTISFVPTTARYIQLRETSSPGTGSWWSLYDLNVYP